MVKININPSKGGKVKKTPNKSTYGYGESLTFTPTQKAGYEFSHWSGDINSRDNPLSITMDGTKSVAANFTEATSSQFSLIGALQSPSDGSSVSAVQPIYGWALDQEGISEVNLFVDGAFMHEFLTEG